MTALLITIFVLGIFEVGSAASVWTVGKFPERTMAGVLVSGLLWACLAAWAGWLLFGGAT